ncbi:hypothetical protein BKCO1_9800017 [Neofusicoccum parvum]|uniref:Uncharacterized protein n=1 Tax=Neofusicoccum parvum TaxID=310453 RepID=A0ACB5SQ94_9PEZI|nr:hypothetical protein BKCO1_9800017 [Neofusicoccum parvum]
MPNPSSHTSSPPSHRRPKSTARLAAHASAYHARHGRSVAHIPIDGGATLVPLSRLVRVRVAAANYDWDVLVAQWTAGRIPDADWLPSEMQIVHDGLVLALDGREGERVDVVGLRGWFVGEVAGMLGVAWRGDVERVGRAREGWVSGVAERLVECVAVSVL